MSKFSNIDDSKVEDHNYALIEHNYEELLYIDFPLLYSGKNIYGNIIIGSYLDEDEEKNEIYALHSYLTNSQFSSYKSGKTSYKQLLEETKKMFLVVYNSVNSTTKVYAYSFELIPHEYIPEENSYFHSHETYYSSEYEISLKGKIADKHEASIPVVSNISKKFAKVVNTLISSFGNQAIVSLTPATKGSYRIGFKLNYTIDNSTVYMYGDPQSYFQNYVSEVIKYFNNNFSEDINLFYDSVSSQSESLLIIESLYNECLKFRNSNKRIINNSIKDEVLKVASVFAELTEEIGVGFDDLEILNIVDNQEIALAFLDSNTSKLINEGIEEILINSNKIIKDSEFKEYQIQIYHLNSDSRYGNANLFLDGSTKVPKPKIKINGKEELAETMYTRSLHESEKIIVMAKATIINGKYSSLEIEYEDKK